MRRQAKSFKAKVRQIFIQDFNEFLATPAGNLRCNIYKIVVKFGKKFFVENHGKSKHNQAGLQRKSRSQSKQTLLQPD